MNWSNGHILYILYIIIQVNNNNFGNPHHVIILIFNIKNIFKKIQGQLPPFPCGSC